MVEASARDVQPRAQSALAKSPICELRDLRVEQKDGALLISGVVSSFYHKQLAQEAVRAVCRGMEIDLVNSIRVQ
jgi:osmotically-inducible protein OsmY